MGLADWLLLILALAAAGASGVVVGLRLGIDKGWRDAQELLADDEPDGPDPSDDAGA